MSLRKLQTGTPSLTRNKEEKKLSFYPLKNTKKKRGKERHKVIFMHFHAFYFLHFSMFPVHFRANSFSSSFCCCCCYFFVSLLLFLMLMPMMKDKIKNKTSTRQNQLVFSSSTNFLTRVFSIGLYK